MILQPPRSTLFPSTTLFRSHGVQILELQIPFSHPTADGPVITAACQVAQQVSTDACLEAIADLRARYPEQEIIVMSYLNRVYAYGAERLAASLQQLGIRRIIVPDLPITSTHAGLADSLRLVPVIAANIPDARLERLLGMDCDFFYLMSDFKITGSTFSLHPRLQDIIRRIKTAKPAARVGIGFGISTPEQALLVAAEADVAIIGSALIQAHNEDRLDAYLDTLQKTFAAQTLVP